MKLILPLLLAISLLSCSPPISVPIPTTDFRSAGKPAKHLIVLLSGRGAPASYFQDHQWVELAREHDVDADFIAPYAHFGYYMQQQLIPRLHQDVIEPAKKQGYETISLLGISMGGMGSILYSEKFPDDVDRIYLVAPYLADEDVHDEIRSAGGLSTWQMSGIKRDDWEYILWQRLKEITTDNKLKNKIFLGYGDKDRLTGHDLLAQNIPAKHVVKISGTHKDVTFRQVWRMMLERGFLEVQEKIAVSH